MFAQKLRRTVSQPVMTLSKSVIMANSKSKIGEGQRVASDCAPPRIFQRSQTTSLIIPSRARNLFAKPDLAKISHDSARKRTKSSSTIRAQQTRSNKVNASPGRRGQKRIKLTTGGLQKLQEAEEGMEGGSKNCVDNEDDQNEREAAHEPSMYRQARDGSPTPSITTTRSFSLAMAGSATSRPKKSNCATRSVSLPSGHISLSKISTKTAREGSAAPSAALTDTDGYEREVESKNKAVGLLHSEN